MDFDRVNESILFEEGERRGRKRKTQNSKEVFEQLPESVTEGFPPETVEELQYCYEILQTIMSMSRIEPFLVRPDSNLFGLSSYYTVIKTPMWLNEVKRKLLEREYSSITQFVFDIRLMLENCYRFWGHSHKFTRKGCKIESKLEQKIDALPEALKIKCSYDDQSSNEILIKNEIADMDESQKEKFDDSPPQSKNDQEVCETSPKSVKGFQSKILCKIMESEDTDKEEENDESQKIKETKMLKWEKETLVSEELEAEMKSMWQLAEIGHFLRITYEVLNVEEITQYEVERMLLMPIESTTLATLMTSMLSPAAVRSSLDVTPIMPYEIWTKRLKKKVEDWFSIYYKKCDAIETYSVNGIEPYFWEVMGLVNPLETKSFHEIDFFQRVWIFKSLCSYLLHTNKCIQDLFMDDSTLDLRPTKLGVDKDGYEYYSLPFLPEIRVYKQRNVHKVLNWGTFVYPENLRTKLMTVSYKFVWNEEDRVMKVHPNCLDFLLVADDMPSLLELLNNVKKDNKSEDLVKGLSGFVKLAKKYRQTWEGLEALYDQWHEFQNKPNTPNNDLNNWESNHVITEPEQSIESTEVTEVLGKRRSKVSLCYADMVMGDDQSEEDSFEESEGSDWECSQKKKKKRGTPKKQAKQDEPNLELKFPDPEPLMSIPSPEQTVEDKLQEDISLVTSVKQELTIDYPDMKPTPKQLSFNIEIANEPPTTQEPLDVKPVGPSAPTIHVIEQLVPFVSQPPERSAPAVNPPVITTNLIKAEVEDDVISISSDEEKDVKPNIKLLNKNKTSSTINSADVANHPVYNGPSLGMAPALVDNRNPLGMQPSLNMRTNLNPMLTPRKVPPPQPWPQPQSQTLRMNNTFNNYMVGSTGSPISPRGSPLSAGGSPLSTGGSPLGMTGSPRGVPGSPMGVPGSPRGVPGSPRGIAGNPLGAPGSPMGVMRSPLGGVGSPRQMSPVQGSPRGRGQYTPRQRLYTSPTTRAASPRASQPRQAFSRNLFQATPPKPVVPSIEGLLEVGRKPDGNYGYQVRLPDGGIIQMSRAEIEEIKKKNNGSLPHKVQVPLIKKPGQFIV